MSGILSISKIRRFFFSCVESCWLAISNRAGFRPRDYGFALLSMFALIPGSYGQSTNFQEDLQALVNEIAQDSSSQIEILSEPFTLDLNTSFAQVTSSNSVDSVSVSSPSDAVTLNFQDADISALINSVSQITGKSFIVDPRVKGKVTLVSGAPLRTNQVYDVFLSVLEVHGFAAVDSGELTKILPANIIKQQPTRTNTGSQFGENDEQVTQVYSLEHASVQELTPILRPLLPPTSHFAPHVGSNTLVFTDTVANIARVLKIVSILDQPIKRSDVHVVMIKNGSAKRISEVIKDVATSLTSSVDGAQGERITVHVDEVLNALVIQAREPQFVILSTLIEQLDVKRTRDGNVHVIYLRYAKASDLVTILNEIATSGQTSGEENTHEDKVSVQADEDTNALVIRASGEVYEELKHVIEKLDLRRSQVFVETIIAEVSTSKAQEIGVEWQGLHQRTSGSDVSISSSHSAASDGGLSVGVINKYVTDLAGNIVPNLNVVLSLLRNDSNTNILSTPNLLTLDNEVAEIVVGQEVPFVTGQFVSDASSSTSTDGSNASGVVNPFQTIERKNVGLTLKITPQINEGGAIRLEVAQEISSVSQTTVSGASDLITNTRSINATVLVDDGQIIVLGGLITDDISDTFEWVPVLGKIPLIGALFRKKTKSSQKRNLMVFLRPKIIRTPADLFEHTQRQYSAIQSDQKASLPDTKQLLKESTIPVLPDLSEER